MEQSFMQRIRETHNDPANIALHVAGWVCVAAAVRRITRGEVGGALARGAIGVGLMGAGHLVEGNEPYGVLRERLRGGTE